LSHIKKITGGDEKLVRTIASKTLCGQEIDKELCDIANNTIVPPTSEQQSKHKKFLMIPQNQYKTHKNLQ
jgi:hypothetical protein